MFKVVLLAFCATAAVATSSAIPSSSAALHVKKDVAAGAADPGSLMGVVSPVYRCGGVGTPLQLRISGCDGSCQLTPGIAYDCELDFIPSSSVLGLTLRVEICIGDGMWCLTIIETELVGSIVGPGLIYTAKYTVIPDDILAGQTLDIRSYLSHSGTGVLEVCSKIYVDTLFP